MKLLKGENDGQHFLFNLSVPSLSLGQRTASIRNRTAIRHQDSAKSSLACAAPDGQFLLRVVESKSGSLSHKPVYSLKSLVMSGCPAPLRF